MTQNSYLKYQIIQSAFEKGESLIEISKQKNIPLRTLQRWLKNYKESDLKGLERRKRKDKGKPRCISQKLLELTQGLAFQKPKKPIAVIHHLINQAAERFGESTPSYHSIYKIVKSLPISMMTLAHEGDKIYEDIFDLLYRREATNPNDIWQADHALLDINLLNDQNKPQKPWLTIIMDDYSRGVAGYYLSFEAPSALQTSLALRQAIWCKQDPEWQICGIPSQLYTDHGSDFTSEHIEIVCADLKVQLIFSTVGKPRGRGKIERFFRTVNQKLLCRLPGYTLNKSSSGTLLSLKEFEKILSDFLINNYNKMPHSQTKETPIVRWSKNGFLPHLPESLEKLDLLLMNMAKPRKIHQDGIRFQGLRYLDPILAAYVGEEITVRYDPRDMAEIRVFYNNQFLCRAICQELAGDLISLKDIIGARRRRKREIKEVINQRKSLVDQLLYTQSVSPSLPEKLENQQIPKIKGIKLYENE